jgi:hypothetical protein
LSIRHPLHIAIAGVTVPLPTLNINRLLGPLSTYSIKSATQSVRDGQLTGGLVAALLDRVALATPLNVQVLGSSLRSLVPPDLLMAIKPRNAAKGMTDPLPESIIVALIPIRLLVIVTRVEVVFDIDEVRHSLSSELATKLGGLGQTRIVIGASPGGSHLSASAWYTKAIASLLAIGGVLKYSTIASTEREIMSRLVTMFGMDLKELQEVHARILESDRDTAAAVQAALLNASKCDEIMTRLEETRAHSSM